MPNFKCLRLKELALPFEKEGVCFEWVAENESVRLILTHFQGQAFFLQVGTNAKNEFIIKGEKHSKPEQIGFLQKALLVFRDNFCENIISEAFTLKSNRLITQSAYIQKDIEGLKAKFKDFKGVFLEIGFGSGRHLLYQARENPEFLMLGVEIYSPAIEQVAKLASIEGLNNVLLVKSDARLLLNVLPAGALAKIFLHFPVPWGKQAGRRVISKDFARQCLRVLERGGKFELRTDSEDYFNESKEIFSTFKNAKMSFAKNENLSISSKYETRWKKQNKDIFDLCVLCENSGFVDENSSENSNENSSISNENSGLLSENSNKNLGFSNEKSENSQLSKKGEFLSENSSIFDENSAFEILKDKNSSPCENSNENSSFSNNNLEFLSKNLTFSPQKLAKIQKKFCNQHFKGEDFFVRLENLYFIDVQNLLLKLVFGAFDKPEHSYLLLNKKSEFLFKKPFATRENLKALQILSEFLR